jgi:hypothetical protein
MTLHWRFRNDHEWQQSFRNEDEMYTFIYRVSLTLHPDVVSVWMMDNGNKTIIF